MKGGRRSAPEVETGKCDARANVRKCVEAGIEEVVAVAVSAAVRDALRARLGRKERTRVLTGGEVLARYRSGRKADTA
jgi:hypothetical protein